MVISLSLVDFLIQGMSLIHVETTAWILFPWAPCLNLMQLQANGKMSLLLAISLRQEMVIQPFFVCQWWWWCMRFIGIDLFYIGGNHIVVFGGGTQGGLSWIHLHVHVFLMKGVRWWWTIQTFEWHFYSWIINHEVVSTFIYWDITYATKIPSWYVTPWYMTKERPLQCWCIRKHSSDGGWKYDACCSWIRTWTSRKQRHWFARHDNMDMGIRIRSQSPLAWTTAVWQQHLHKPKRTISPAIHHCSLSRIHKINKQ